MILTSNAGFSSRVTMLDARVSIVSDDAEDL